MGTLSALNLAAVAEDSESLRVDDVLRGEHARRAIAPYAVAVALVVMTNSSISSWVTWSFLGYSVVGFGLWALAERSVTCRAVAVP